MYLKGAINADSILTFSGGETRDTQSQQEGSGRDVLIVLSIKAADQCRPNMGAEAKHKRARVCTQGRSSVTSAKITMYTGRREKAYTETQKDKERSKVKYTLSLVQEDFCRPGQIQTLLTGQTC